MEASDLIGNYDVVVVGCGLSGATVARFVAERLNKKVLVMERRNHVGGNMYDYINEHGILVHKYGPHTFHTKKKNLYEFMCKYSEWENYALTCGAVIDGKYTPTPFNFQTIDDFYDAEQAEKIKAAIANTYGDRDFVTVLEMLHADDPLIKGYAEFLFEKDYSLYTAKQWGVSPSEIDPSILRRVPIRLNYDIGYFDDEYQVMPKVSYADFFDNILKHPNIDVMLNVNSLEYIHLDENEGEILAENNPFKGLVVYTGAIDELLEYRYGQLPYRSLRFDWKTDNVKSFQDAPVVAYPQAPDFTRITEYTKLPVQDVGNKTTYAIEYSIPYKSGIKGEPYYPVLTEQSKEKYNLYVQATKKYDNLILCGRLADFKYYNMDEALERALEICSVIEARMNK